MKHMKTLILGFGLSFGAAGLTGCNTIRGAGEDVEATGEAVQEVAEDTEKEIKEAF